MDLLIRNVRLIDGTGSAPRSPVSLQVSNGAIAWIGEESVRPRNKGHQEDINGQGLTLIPGLMVLCTKKSRRTPGVPQFVSGGDKATVL